MLYAPDCPLAGRVRDTVAAVLARTGSTAKVEERVGPYPSPTLLIDGVDVAGETPTVACCRLDLPTAEQLTRALARTR